MNALVQRSQIDACTAEIKTVNDAACGTRQRPIQAWALKRHPAFSQIRDMMIGNMVGMFRGDYLLGRLLLEEGRFTIFQTILCLGASQVAEDRNTWLTLGRLQTCLAASKLNSRNRIEALVAIFERYGFLERRKAEEDLRVTVLVPTARMWASDAALMEAQTSPLFLAASQRKTGAFSSLRGSRPGFGSSGQRGWRKSFANHLPAFLDMRAKHESVMQLAARDGGYLLFLMLLQEGLTSGKDCIALPYESISDHAGVSRTHARLLMEQAQESGFIRLLARGGREVEILPHAWQAADSWFADNMAFLARSL